MRDAIAQQLKSALKSGDKSRVSTLRMVQAAIKDRDIANRGLAKDPAGDDDVLQILTRMVKQRQESARAFEDGGRPELAAQERSEIAILEEFLPSRMDEGEARAAIAETIAALGAAGPRDMGRVMSALKEKFAGRMDFSSASGIVKEMLA
jgi:uncharacterized protein YqeY